MEDFDLFKYFRDVTSQTSQLEREGYYHEALRVLDEAIARMKAENSIQWLRLLCSHAEILCGSDFSRVRYYREQLLACDPANPYLLANLADLLFEHGQDTPAKQYAFKAYTLAINSEDQDLLQRLKQRWPQVGQWNI